MSGHTQERASGTDAKAPLTLEELTGLDIEKIKGVGPKKASGLRKVGVNTVLDLLRTYPRRYVDRTKLSSIADLVEGDEAVVGASVTRVDQRRLRGRRSMVTATVEDGTGSLQLSFFNQPWRANQLSVGTMVSLFGKVGSYRGRLQMSSPVVDLVGDQTARVMPVYPQSEKASLSSLEISRWVGEAIRRTRARQVDDPLPDWVREQYELIDRDSAIHWIHLPETMAQVGLARRRLVFDELFAIQLELVAENRKRKQEQIGVEHAANGTLTEALVDRLGFDLTRAQTRVIGEIAHDMDAHAPMHRLLQGDVGSGKTLVALMGMLRAVEGGFQAALMAPTEVLAEQHHVGIARLLRDLSVPDPTTLLGERPLTVELLSNSVGTADRKRILNRAITGQLDLLIGTHALIESSVEFFDLGMVVIDEQHRFGVEQRASLRDKGRAGKEPDVLVMTATPIPRTAAMTVFGDLDVSVLDELPPGRTPINTRHIEGPLEEESMWSDVREEIAKGRQVYVVCPLIDVSESIEVRSVTETYEELTAGVLADHDVRLLHGRMPSAEKEAVMEAFRSRTADVLVSTTVIEVGVDVPNATVMVILDAGRFGIAQLHQLRGRVGRGDHRSTCFLVGEASTEDAKVRIGALVESTDGFALAEADLELRGEGTILGDRQKGRSDLRLASLRRDRDMVSVARDVAERVLDSADESMAALRDDARWLIADENTDYLRMD